MAGATDEHGLIYEPDQLTRARELLLWQQRERPRIDALVASFAAGAQLAENTMFAVLIGASTFDGAEGVTLDRWGEIVGEFRGGLDETEFRKFIRLRIRINTEHPSEDAMYEILSEAVDPSPVTTQIIADGIVYQVDGEDGLDRSISAHAAALIRDFRPIALYAPVVEFVTDHFALDWEADAPFLTDGTGTAVLAELTFSGRSR